MPDELETRLGDRLIRRGDPRYDAARDAAVWRANKPHRFPQAIVLAATAADVQDAVALAKAEGLKVGVRSGGHSWVSPHIRDGSLLIDLSPMQDLSIDAGARTAWVQPSVKGRRLNDALAAHGLMAPTGHHNTVGCGGFLLCGGFGWNFRQWGNGCLNVIAIEIVTPDGDLIRASETENPDWFWAARGGGPGFFGAVVRFQVKAYPRPTHLSANVMVFPADLAEPVLTWLHEMSRKAPRYVELVASAYSWTPQGDWSPTRLSVAGLTFANSDAEAAVVADLFETCPYKDQATFRLVNQPTTLEERYDGATAVDPEGYRFAADNLYSDAEPADIARDFAQVIKALPTPYSHTFWLFQGPRPPELERDVALSAWGEVYLAAYSIWDDPAQDDAMLKWPVDQMRTLDNVTNGEGQMNDENIEARPIRYLSEAAEARLEVLRAQHDPGRLFVSFLR